MHMLKKFAFMGVLAASLTTAQALSYTICEVMLYKLGSKPCGKEIKDTLGLDTVLFEDQTQYRYSCALTGAVSAKMAFYRADLCNPAVLDTTKWQSPNYIRLGLYRQPDNSILVRLPQ